MTRPPRATTSSGALIKITLQVEPETLEALDTIAALSHESRSSVVRRLVERGLSVERKLTAIAEHVA